MRDPVALSLPDCSQRLVRQGLNDGSREGHLAQKKWPSRPGDPVATLRSSNELAHPSDKRMGVGHHILLDVSGGAMQTTSLTAMETTVGNVVGRRLWFGKSTRNCQLRQNWGNHTQNLAQLKGDGASPFSTRGSRNFQLRHVVFSVGALRKTQHGKGVLRQGLAQLVCPARVPEVGGRSRCVRGSRRFTFYRPGKGDIARCLAGKRGTSLDVCH